MTQAYPTNFHQFWTTKVLALGESIADYMEVSAKERAALEESDSKWVRPPQIFIDLWNEACKFGSGTGANRVYGQYNEETGYFELNGITDITYEEAVAIYIASFRVGGAIGNTTTSWATSMNNWKSMWNWRCRTLFPIYADNINGICQYSNAEVLQFINYYICNNNTDKHTTIIKVTNTRDAFYQNAKLREVYPILQMPTSDTQNAHFYNSTGCACLELIKLHGVCLPIAALFTKTPVIKIISLQYLVENAANTAEISITVHPAVYAKLLGEGDYSDGNGTKEQWEKLLQDAAARQIMFASA